VVTRRYEQKARALSAQETRRRILDAVYAQLQAAPARAVSVDRVARDAGVARSTVYAVFGSRAGLFDAFALDLLERAGMQRVYDAVRHEDVREHLRGGLRGGAHAFAGHRDVSRALYSMAAIDPDAAAGAVQRLEARRAKGMAHLARRLSRAGLLRDDITVAQAADLLWLLASFDAFDQLYTGRGLSAEAVGDVLVATAERSLLR